MFILGGGLHNGKIPLYCQEALKTLLQSDDKTVSMEAGMGLEHNKYIQVTDSAPVIPPPSIDGIFVPFHPTKKEGNGIGLAISRQIMDLHKGSLQR